MAKIYAQDMEHLGFETLEQPSLEQLKNSTMLWKNRSAKTLLLILLLWGQPSSHKVTSYPRVSSPFFSLLNFSGFHFMLVWAETFQNYQRRVTPAYVFCLQSVSNILYKIYPKMKRICCETLLLTMNPGFKSVMLPHM